MRARRFNLDPSRRRRPGGERSSMLGAAAVGLLFAFGMAAVVLADGGWKAPDAGRGVPVPAGDGAGGAGDPSTPVLTISPVELRVLGQDRWLVGSRASLRILVSDHDRGVPLPAEVRVSLAPSVAGAPARTLYSGRTNALGTIDASFPVPRLAAGSYRMTVAASTELGDDRLVQDVNLQESADLFLTTDKPLYQPGQTIHVRSIALRRPDRRPFRSETLTFEIEDAKGNKVFKHVVETDRFGVASVDFTLASEVNTGLYTIRAIHPSATAEKKVTVDRYVLPKFKVVVKTDRPYYRPGDTVTGTLRADYFFGKPVASGKITVRLATLTVGVEEIGRIEGTTDAQGSFRFEYELPRAFVGQPLDNGRATVQIEAAVVDGADHQEKGRLSIPVSRDLLDVAVIPAGRSLVAGVQNTIYIATARPDGSPTRAHVTVRGASVAQPEAMLQTDELGLVSFTFVPDAERVTLSVAARDEMGNAGQTKKDLASAGPPGEGVVLAASKALAAVGNTVALTVFSPSRAGAVFVDVIRDRQTVLTRALDLENGRATMSLPLTPDLAGTIQVHAYRILTDENIVRDTRTIYVSQADDLKVTIRPAQDTWRPGERAAVDFAVVGPDGRGVASVLGVAGVDESVFALSELQPGLEKIYFTLEKELMEPRYEIHGLEPSEIVGGDPLPIPAPGPGDGAAARQRRERLRDEAARVVFAAAPPFADFTVRANTYTARFEKAKASWMSAMQADHDRIREALERYRRRHVNPLPAGQEETLLDERLVAARDLRDPWGRSYRIFRRGGDDVFFTLKSAGPDGRWGTNDDLEYGRQEWLRQRAIFAEEGVMRIAPMAAMDAVNAPAPLMAAKAANASDIGGRGGSKEEKDSRRDEVGGGAEAIRVRQFFPETLYWNPSVITDGAGKARVTLALADSITTWRLTALAGDAAGRLGSAEAPLRVFQDFFVDVDLPVWLTRGDEVGVPVALYNYLREPQTVTLEVSPEEWFTALPGEGAAARGTGKAEITLGAGEVAGVVFPIRVEKFGRHAFTLTARGSRLSDAVKREIEVLPEGREFRDTVNDRLDTDVAKEIVIPDAAIAGASSLFVKIYPGLFSQAVEGLEALLRMPSGCFEQTSSTTYPNVLVLAYLKETKQASPELRMKAEQFINVGYQRLLTYEVDGGGFSWFGDPPAHQVLTAYGLLEFADMAKVHDVDPALIERTQRWLAERQKADGTWDRDAGGIAEGIINRQTDTLRTTAYIAWALADSGYRGPEVERALNWLRGQAGRADDPYALALVTNAFAAHDRRSAEARGAAERLARLGVEREGGVTWSSKAAAFTGAEGASADLETTGLAAYALLRTGVAPETARKALTHLIRGKDAFGTWQTTQATVWALRALLAATTAFAADTDATVGVICNGEEKDDIRVRPEDSDLMRQVDCGAVVKEGRNEVRIRFEGKGTLLYQIVSRYYVPWDRIPEPPRPLLTIDVEYDRTALAKDDVVTERVKVTNTSPRAATNVIVDLAVPPGFDVMTEDLQALVGKEISRFEPAGRQVILYVDRVEPGRPLSFSLRLRARMMVRAVNGESAVYPYYNPEQRGVEKPVRFVSAALSRGRSAVK